MTPPASVQTPKHPPAGLPAAPLPAGIPHSPWGPCPGAGEERCQLICVHTGASPRFPPPMIFVGDALEVLRSTQCCSRATDSHADGQGSTAFGRCIHNTPKVNNFHLGKENKK